MPTLLLNLLFTSSMALRLTVLLLLCRSFLMTSKNTDAGKRRLTLTEHNEMTGQVLPHTEMIYDKTYTRPGGLVSLTFARRLFSKGSKITHKSK